MFHETRQRDPICNCHLYLQSQSYLDLQLPFSNFLVPRLLVLKYNKGTIIMGLVSKILRDNLKIVSVWFTSLFQLFYSSLLIDRIGWDNLVQEPCGSTRKCEKRERLNEHWRTLMGPTILEGTYWPPLLWVMVTWRVALKSKGPKDQCSKCTRLPFPSNVAEAPIASPW